jgi:hypothetical protein
MKDRTRCILGAFVIIRTPRPGSESRELRSTSTAGVLAAAAVAAGAAAWIFYLREGLVLSHYDAKAHLVVARRVIDNITPGWQQIGAVWLPLPHLIQLLPVQIDLFYRTGAFGSIVSLACLGITTWAACRLVLLLTGSRTGAFTAAALLVLNPNVLYLHVTPMTEPLLMAATFVSVLWLYEWLAQDRDDVPPKLGWMLFAAAWTRYEAWAIVASAGALAIHAMWRGAVPAGTLARRIWRLGRWPAAAGLLFLLNSRATVGAWFVSGGFYVPDPTYAGQAWRSLVAVWWGTHQLSGYVVEVAGLTAAGALLVRGLARGRQAAALVPVALFAAAAVPFAAFHEGHPYRIRYMMPLVCACALFSGVAVGLLGTVESRVAASGSARGRSQSGSIRRYARLASGPLLAVLLIGSAFLESPPWQEHAPFISEAQWDVPVSLNRRAVTACLAGRSGGEKVLASMGSLAHYMQELSHEGFDIADFIHEGTGVIWRLALETGPRPHAAWMLVEEEAEGGDILAQRIRQDSAFADGMTRVCEGGGVALYQARP